MSAIGEGDEVANRIQDSAGPATWCAEPRASSAVCFFSPSTSTLVRTLVDRGAVSQSWQRRQLNWEAGMASRREQLVGNRLALAGTVVYFMEWVVIPFAPSLPTDKLGKDPSAIVAAYGHHPARTAFLAGWLSFVLLGRILFSAGLRSAFRASLRELAWADWALGA